MLMEEKGFKERWESEDQERTVVVRREEKTDDSLQEIKMVVLISIDFAINMVRQHACLLFDLFSDR